jgi:hypothetical protein
MTTEHFTLQTARASTISETNGRVSVFLGTISSALIALAFVGQVSKMGQAFAVFSLILFPPLCVLGLFTFGRTLQSAIEDVQYARGINRIRHYYLELAPEMRDYLVEPTTDDLAGVMRGMGMRLPHRHLFLHTSEMVAVINSVLVGVFGGLSFRLLLLTPLPAAIAIGAAVFLTTLITHYRWELSAWGRADRSARTLFPSR